MGLYDRDYMREPQSDDDAYVRRLTAHGIVRPRRRVRGHGRGEVEHEVLVPADGSLWPEFEGLPVKRTIVVPQSPTRIVPRASRRRKLGNHDLRIAVVVVGLTLFGCYVLPHLIGWRVIAW